MGMTWSNLFQQKNHFGYNVDGEWDGRNPEQGGHFSDIWIIQARDNDGLKSNLGCKDGEKTDTRNF